MCQNNSLTILDPAKNFYMATKISHGIRRTPITLYPEYRDPYFLTWVGYFHWGPRTWVGYLTGAMAYSVGDNLSHIILILTCRLQVAAGAASNCPKVACFESRVFIEN